MGRATRWLRGLLGGGGGKKPSYATPPPPSSVKEKKKWFGRSSKEKERQITQPQRSQPVSHAAVVADGDEQNKHAIAMAAATAAVAEAAVAAAQAAAAVVRLTSSGRGSAGPGLFAAVAKREESAAVEIQSAFRGYLARRALSALRGLVKLQALVRGYIVRRQMAETLRCMHALVRAQARARAVRALSSEDPCFNKSSSPHLGPSMPDKPDPFFPSNALRPDRHSSLKRNSSKPAVMDPNEEGKSHQSGWNWLDRWIEERHMGSREYTTKSMVGAAMDDERNAKILEVDLGRPKQRSKCRSSHHYSACSTLTSDLNSHSFATVQDSPSKDSTVAQMSILSPSSVDMPQSLSPPRFPIAIEAVDRADCPQFYSACSRPGSSRRGPFTPSKSDCSRSLFSGYSDYPNYMANTESSRAKARSQSAPRQRPEYEKSHSLRRASMHGFNQHVTSGAVSRRSSSLHANFINKAYPGSGRL